MRTVLLALGATLSIVVSAAAQSTQQPGAADEALIRAIVDEQVKAWNAGDAVGFSKSFAEHGSFTNIRGTVFYGHQAFEDRHREIFTGFFKGSRLAMSISRIRFVRPDVAIVDLATEVSNLSGTPPGVRPNAAGRIVTRLQQVFVRDGGIWRVESYHNVDVKE
jgi:uncharacterized protein (TIGR02246 family)